MFHRRRAAHTPISRHATNAYRRTRLTRLRLTNARSRIASEAIDGHSAAHVDGVDDEAYLSSVIPTHHRETPHATRNTYTRNSPKLAKYMIKKDFIRGRRVQFPPPPPIRHHSLSLDVSKAPKFGAFFSRRVMASPVIPLELPQFCR